jgi:hypothetical protein
MWTDKLEQLHACEAGVIQAKTSATLAESFGKSVRGDYMLYLAATFATDKKDVVRAACAVAELVDPKSPAVGAVRSWLQGQCALPLPSSAKTQAAHAVLAYARSVEKGELAPAHATDVGIETVRELVKGGADRAAAHLQCVAIVRAGVTVTEG